MSLRTIRSSSTVEEYKDSLKTKAEHLILKEFPEKIVRLNELLETSQFKEKDSSKVHQELNIPVPEPVSLQNCNNEPVSKKRKQDHEDIDGTKVFSIISGTVPCNKYLTDVIKIVKPYIKELIEDANILKMWVSFMIPKIEDGNNFGVSVQEETLEEIQSVESEAATYFDQISRYHATRAKLVSKVAKYPHIDDYRTAIQELDERSHLSLWLIIIEIRNRYCTLHDIVIKNLEKIKRPRSSNAVSLY
ncbi:proteasome activator complex subunit 3 isoform X1 [Bemisia tabaci]|uniref:proteasome activator complex subunit 3 isoform X1 n=1 Tax=Bemisia tabaci TaxID=7038 RepID=UPI003B28085C